MTAKVLGIGLQRTGTTSLYHALKELGHNAAPDAIALFYNPEAPVLHQYEAFMDNPIPLLYQSIDKRIPSCKFILTTRSRTSWLRSVQWLFEEEFLRLSPSLQKIGNDIHQEFYGSMKFDEDIFTRKWKQYHEEVERYFLGREEDLLVIDFEQGDGWESLCAFLNKKIPNCPFPHRNGAR